MTTLIEKMEHHAEQDIGMLKTELEQVIGELQKYRSGIMADAYPGDIIWIPTTEKIIARAQKIRTTQSFIAHLEKEIQS